MCVSFVAQNTYHSLTQSSELFFLPSAFQGSVGGKCPSIGRGYWDSGCAVNAGALHGGAKEGHLCTLHSAPGAAWALAPCQFSCFPHFTLRHLSKATTILSFPPSSHLRQEHYHLYTDAGTDGTAFPLTSRGRPSEKYYD